MVGEAGVAPALDAGSEPAALLLSYSPKGLGRISWRVWLVRDSPSEGCSLDVAMGSIRDAVWQSVAPWVTGHVRYADLC